MSSVLVFCEVGDSGLKKGSLELLSAVQSANLSSQAVLMGPRAKAASAQAAAFAEKVWIMTDDRLTQYNSEVFTTAAVQIIKEAKASRILATASMMGRDLFPRVAARLEAGVASDCTTLDLSGGQLKARKPLYSGKCTAEVEFVDSAIQMVLMRPNQLPVVAANRPSPGQTQEVSLAPVDAKTTVEKVVQGEVGKIDLTEANVIVAGGRGLKGAEHFKMLEDLAQTVHGTVGASRAVADAGWVPHSMQVGQTGKTVAPSLYIAVGISGAIQHLAGMSGSKVIVAVNKDPEAPIFQKSTYGVVGDLFDIVPKLNSAFKDALK